MDLFPSTCWSRILAGAEAEASRGPDLDALARAYWRPVCAWLCAEQRLGEEDAGDLTQDFFAWMLESGFAGKADPARGRFRAFLKTVLRRFAIDRRRRDRAQLRGGGRPVLSLDAGGEEPAGMPASTLEPDLALAEAWRAAAIKKAFEALEAELSAEGRGTAFAVFRDDYLAPEPAPDHRALARGQRAAARAACDQALDLDPRLAAARFERGLLSADDQPAAALDDLSAPVPEDAGIGAVDLLFGRAETCRLGKDLAEARRLPVRDLDPFHLQAVLSLSKVASEQGDAEAALAFSLTAVNLQRGMAAAAVPDRGR